MLHIIKANVPLRSLNTVSVASDVDCHEPVEPSGARPASESFDFWSRRIVPPPIRAQCLSPTLAIEFRRAEEIAARMHHHLPVNAVPHKVFCADLVLCYGTSIVGPRDKRAHEAI